jgi:hypothetical protein
MFVLRLWVCIMVSRKSLLSGQRHERIVPFHCYGSGGFEGLPLDFDDAEFYRRFDRFSTSGGQRRKEDTTRARCCSDVVVVCGDQCLS